MYSQEVGGTVVEDGFVVLAGAEWVEWYQMHHTHGFHVPGVIMSHPSAASTAFTTIYLVDHLLVIMGVNKEKGHLYRGEKKRT